MRILSQRLSSKTSAWSLLLVLAYGLGVISADLFSSPADETMAVTFVNASSQPIVSIRLDFGSAALQSTIRALRIAPGESRTLLLNHAPGLGFNVDVRYADGTQQTFCALRGDSRAQVSLQLQPGYGE